MKHNEGFLTLVQDAKSRVSECSVDDVAAMQEREEEFHLVDVREDGEWEKGHAPGAVHLGKGVIERDIERTIPDKRSKIVLYCGGGYRSALAAEALQKMGYQNVLSMDGGVRDWVESGRPVEGAAD